MSSLPQEIWDESERLAKLVTLPTFIDHMLLGEHRMVAVMIQARLLLERRKEENVVINQIFDELGMLRGPTLGQALRYVKSLMAEHKQMHEQLAGAIRAEALA